MLFIFLIEMFLLYLGSTEVIVYSAQGINDPVTSAMHIIFGNFIFTSCITGIYS